MEHNDSYSLNSSGQIQTAPHRLLPKVAVAAIRIVSSINEVEVLRGMHMSTAMVSVVLVFFAALSYGQTSRATSGAAPAEFQPKGSIGDYFLGAWKLVSTE